MNTANEVQHRPSRRTLGLTLAGLLFVPAIVTRALAADPPLPAKAFVEDIYRNYVGSSLVDAKGVPLADADAVRRYFSAGLASLILDDRKQAAGSGKSPVLDGDPFVGRQDWKIDDLVVDITGGALKAVGTVTFINFGKPDKIVLDLLKSGPVWRIADIRWSAGTLRGLFRKK